MTEIPGSDSDKMTFRCWSRTKHPEKGLGARKERSSRSFAPRFSASGSASASVPLMPHNKRIGQLTVLNLSHIRIGKHISASSQFVFYLETQSLHILHSILHSKSDLPDHIHLLQLSRQFNKSINKHANLKSSHCPLNRPIQCHCRRSQGRQYNDGSWRD